VTSKEDLSRIVDSITATDGFINVLIVNSGVFGPSHTGLPPSSSLSTLREFLWKTDPAQFTQVYNVNVTGVFFAVVAFLDLLGKGNEKGNVEQKSQVIATSSVAGFNRNVLGYAYGTSKAATTHLMKQFATGFVPYHIRSNVIAPGCKSLLL
jgi:NAD(P)-dependent dehydrogenase (short-subunit alcohol dehydrogenase family)